MECDFERNEQTDCRNLCLKQKEAHTIPFYQSLSRINFKIVFSRSCSPSWILNRHILEILTCRETLVVQNHQASVRLHWCVTVYLQASIQAFCLQLFFAKDLVSFTYLNVSMRCFHGGHQSKIFWSLGLKISRKSISDTFWLQKHSLHIVCLQQQFYNSIQDKVFTIVYRLQMCFEKCLV